MKTVKYVPKFCTKQEVKNKNGSFRTVEPTFEGFVELSRPDFDERFDNLDKIDVDLEQLSSLPQKEQIKAIRKVVSITKHHYVSVNLKRKSDGVEFKTFEDISGDNSCNEIISEIGMALLGGFGPDPK